MAAFDVDVFRSRQFAFVVGKNQATFSVHAAIIAKQSKALDVLINGSMGEAVEGKAIFEDIQEDTFVRFCQFAYTGDYTTPDFSHDPTIENPATDRNDSKSIEPQPEEVLESESEPPEPEPGPVDDFGWGSTTATRSFKKGKKTWRPPEVPKPSITKTQLLKQSLDSQFYGTETIRSSSAARCEVRQNSDPAEDYTAVFLGHAQLYAFAEKYDIKPLKTLALFKLHKTLTSFTLYAARRPDIVELLRYTFSNDHTPDLVGATDDLRSLVMLYTVCEVDSLAHCPEFLSLIGEGGELAQNLVQMMMKRVS